jgi:hypothetical protein
MILNMLRASLCSSSGGQLYIYSIWYRPTLYGSIQSGTIPDTLNIQGEYKLSEDFSKQYFHKY